VPTYLLLASVWLISALYMGMYLNRGWHDDDDGTLAQSAERQMLGELPHRDFDESYTGGPDYLNAAAFRIFGTNLAGMRYPFYIFFLAWLPAIFFVARQFGPAWMAAGLRCWRSPGACQTIPLRCRHGTTSSLQHLAWLRQFDISGGGESGGCL
jgi:hypothetical protein